jgi:hypothetical protein
VPVSTTQPSRLPAKKVINKIIISFFIFPPALFNQ